MIASERQTAKPLFNAIKENALSDKPGARLGNQVSIDRDECLKFAFGQYTLTEPGQRLDDKYICRCQTLKNCIRRDMLFLRKRSTARNFKMVKRKYFSGFYGTKRSSIGPPCSVNCFVEIIPILKGCIIFF